MDTSQISQESINKIIDLCRYLRSDMGAIFVENMADFLSELPEQLVEAADKAPLTDQQDYFDIITLLRRESEQIHLGMNAAITICIEEFVHYVQNVDKVSSPEDIKSLSLIDTDDIEVTIVTEGLAGRVASKFSETMNDAYLRIKQLVPPLQQATQLPCHPRALIQAMLDSMATLSLNTKQKVLLSNLFTPKIDAARLEQTIKQSFQDANIPQFDKKIKNLDHNGANTDASPAEENPDTNMDVSGSNPHRSQNTIGQKTHPNNHAMPHQHGESTSHNASLLANGNHVAGADASGNALTSEINNDVRHHNEANSASTTDFERRVPQATNRVFNNANELLQQLGNLKALRQQMAKMPVTPAPKNPMVSEQTLGTQALDGILSDIQQEQPIVSVRENADIQPISEVRQEIRSRLHSDDETVQTIEDKDSDVINLVSLMFDYILDNPNLPTAMKALLARLQIPMLRVALLTPSFFAESDHPARQLLDQLSKAGISWDKATDKDAYYDKLESIVFRVIKEFRDDISVFEDLLQELNAFLTKQEELSERIGNRTKSTEEKRAQTELSKSYVQKHLNERLIGKKLPFAVIKILQNGWWHVLYHTFVRHGRDSNQWKNALKVVDALVWSVIPPAAGRQQWLDQVNKIQLKLIDNLRKGLTQVNFDPMQRSQLLQEIESIHADVIKEREIQQINVALESTQTTEEALTHDLKSTLDKLTDDTSTPKTQASPFKKAGDKVEEIAADVLNTSTPSSVTLPNDKPVVTEVDTTNEPIDPECLKQVKSMNNGTWVEFKADTDSPERCKLVAKIRALDKLVFTNRRGIKVAEVGQSKLARQLSNGKARIIEEQASIVETAMNSVLGDLDKLESKQLSKAASS